MGFSLPNPTVPTNGQSLDATPLLANIVAIAQAIASFDGSQIQAASIVAAAFNANINPNTLLKETTTPFVASGLVWSTISGLAAGMTSGVLYYNGIRVPVNSVSTKTFTVSVDTYIDIDVNGNITYPTTTNGGAAPALTASSIRVAKVVTSGSAITSISQFGADSLGNIIYPSGSASAAKLQNPYKFSVYLSASQNAATGAASIKYDTKLFDTGVNVDIATNKGRFTASIAGYYQFNARTATTQGSGTNRLVTSLYKNGSEISRGTDIDAGFLNGSNVSDLLQLNAGDYVEAYVFGSGTLALDVSTSAMTRFSGFLVSAE